MINNEPSLEKIISARVEVAGILVLKKPQWSHIDSNHSYNQFSNSFCSTPEQEPRTELEKEFSRVLWLAKCLEG